MATVYTYDTPGQYSRSLTSGTWLIECWGAQGGYRSSSSYGGKGGYARGYLTLTASLPVYIRVGGSGNSGTITDSVYSGGFNGGGCRHTYYGGGGASDVGLYSNTTSNYLYYRLVVAGGGGSDGATAKGGGAGGGLQGQNTTASSYGTGGFGGTQTGNTSSSTYSSATSQATSSTGLTTQAESYAGFGFGGGGIFRSSGYGGAGGGGWYGGVGTYPDGSGDDDKGGGGGSGYVYTADTANNRPNTSYKPSTSYYLTDPLLIAGNQSMPATGTDAWTSSTITGKEGNGYVRITLITKKKENPNGRDIRLNKVVSSSSVQAFYPQTTGALTYLDSESNSNIPSSYQDVIGTAQDLAKQLASSAFTTPSSVTNATYATMFNYNRYIDGALFTGSVNRSHRAYVSTAAATSAKVASYSDYSTSSYATTANGTLLIVRWTYGNTATSATLKLNSGTAYTISNISKFTINAENYTLMLFYNSAWYIVGVTSSESAAFELYKAGSGYGNGYNFNYDSAESSSLDRFKEFNYGDFPVSAIYEEYLRYPAPDMLGSSTYNSNFSSLVKTYTNFKNRYYDPRSSYVYDSIRQIPYQIRKHTFDMIPCGSTSAGPFINVSSSDAFGLPKEFGTTIYIDASVSAANLTINIGGTSETLSTAGASGNYWCVDINPIESNSVYEYLIIYWVVDAVTDTSLIFNKAIYARMLTFSQTTPTANANLHQVSYTLSSAVTICAAESAKLQCFSYPFIPLEYSTDCCNFGMAEIRTTYSSTRSTSTTPTSTSLRYNAINIAGGSVVLASSGWVTLASINYATNTYNRLFVFPFKYLGLAWYHQTNSSNGAFYYRTNHYGTANTAAKLGTTITATNASTYRIPMDVGGKVFDGAWLYVALRGDISSLANSDNSTPNEFGLHYTLGTTVSLSNIFSSTINCIFTPYIYLGTEGLGDNRIPFSTSATTSDKIDITSKLSEAVIKIFALRFNAYIEKMTGSSTTITFSKIELSEHRVIHGNLIGVAVTPIFELGTGIGSDDINGYYGQAYRLLYNKLYQDCDVWYAIVQVTKSSNLFALSSYTFTGLECLPYFCGDPYYVKPIPKYYAEYCQQSTTPQMYLTQSEYFRDTGKTTGLEDGFRSFTFGGYFYNNVGNKLIELYKAPVSSTASDYLLYEISGSYCYIYGIDWSKYARAGSPRLNVGTTITINGTSYTTSWKACSSGIDYEILYGKW